MSDGQGGTKLLKGNLQKNVKEKFSNKNKPDDAKQKCFVSSDEFFKDYQEVPKKKPNTFKELARPDSMKGSVWTLSPGRACFDWPGLRTGTLERAQIPLNSSLQPGDVASWGFPNVHFAVYEGKGLFSQLDGTDSNVEFIKKDDLYKQRGNPLSILR
ncbi:MAG: hypothetical protein KF708_00810 [Pirellulales bacterium]|nr:hypothetical protein [Pirellulales bacterium]